LSVRRGLRTLEFDHNVGDFFAFKTGFQILCILTRPTPKDDLLLNSRIVFPVGGLAVVAQPCIALVADLDLVARRGSRFHTDTGKCPGGQR
jgi:hypothetical protein